MVLYDTSKPKEKAVLVGVHTGCLDKLKDCTDESIEELTLLAETAGAEVVGVFVQNRPSPENSTYVGEGKITEIKEFCETNDIDVVIFDDELSGSQVRNIEADLGGIHVMDRSSLIMDIFASRAITKEGILQVELAQLKYYLPRLSGSFVNLSRLGGGIGTRGPGETKLECDKRHIRNRISYIKSELEDVVKNRETQRRARKKENILQIAIIGYTNSGKSTLLNFLTDAGVLAENKLFATLDPTAKKLTLPDGTKSILIDTVGFIRKLPHHLIDAFKSTLEEAVIADILVHVVDSSSPNMDDNIKIVNDLLKELGAGDKPSLTVYNKCDISDYAISDKSVNSIGISAKTGYNITEMLNMICEINPNKRKEISVLIPYSCGSLLPVIYADALVKKEEHRAEGTYFEILCDNKMTGILSDYIV